LTFYKGAPAKQSRRQPKKKKNGDLHPGKVKTIEKSEWGRKRGGILKKRYLRNRKKGTYGFNTEMPHRRNSNPAWKRERGKINRHGDCLGKGKSRLDTGKTQKNQTD